MTRIIAFAIAVAAAAGAYGAPLGLAVRGKPAEYVIVRPEKASPSQAYAAEELQKFTEQMTGVKLAIATDSAPLPAKAIVIAAKGPDGLKKAPKELGTDGFRLVAQGQRLWIIGSADRGGLYGVYELLESFGGCKWYASWHSVIPQLKEFTAPEDLDRTETPAFIMREPFWYDAFNGDFAARLRVTGTRARLEPKHGGHPVRFGAELWACHTFQQLLSVEEFYKTHPEYFALRNGRRDSRADAQLCLTNPDVLRIVTERLKQRIRQDPGATFYGVSQNDNFEYCQCPACKAIDDREDSHSGTMVQFVNAVAEAVEKDFPGVMIETLAYQYTRKPPKTLRLRHNVVPCLCTIECDFSFPLNKSAFPSNRAFVDDIRKWSAQASQLYIWDYTTDFVHYTRPFPNVLALQGNIKFFRDSKVLHLFEQGAYQGRHGDFAELKAWLMAKWMWNPDLPAEPLLEDFFNGYYGKAAPYVRTYFDALHSFYRDSEATPLRVFDDVRGGPIPDDFYLRALALWRQAEEAVKGDAACSYNVRMGEFPVLYARLMRMPAEEAKTVWATRSPSSPRFQASEEYRTLAKTLLARMDEAKDIRLSESMEGHNDRIASWKKLAAPPVAPPPAADRAVIEDSQLTLQKEGTWGDRVKDPLAGDGSALRLFNTHFEWCTTLPLSKVAYDQGVKYRIRARLRLEKKPGVEGRAVWMGVYDPLAKRGCGERDLNTGDFKTDGYEWYDVLEWTPGEGNYFWIGPGTFDDKTGKSSIKALYIDKLEIIRAQ